MLLRTILPPEGKAVAIEVGLPRFGQADTLDMHTLTCDVIRCPHVVVEGFE
jgi:hypothetical protein